MGLRERHSNCLSNLLRIQNWAGNTEKRISSNLVAFSKNTNFNIKPKKLCRHQPDNATYSLMVASFAAIKLAPQYCWSWKQQILCSM